MNNVQTQTTIAPIITFLAGLLAGKGVFGWDSATWIAVLGGAAGLAATIWAAVATRKSAMVSSVAAMPEVKEVALERTNENSRALNEATPNNVVIK